MRVVTLGGLGANAPFVAAPGAVLKGFGTCPVPYTPEPVQVTEAQVEMALLDVAACGFRRGLWIGLGIGVMGGALAAIIARR
jgi:hypothetical protein